MIAASQAQAQDLRFTCDFLKTGPAYPDTREIGAPLAIWLNPLQVGFGTGPYPDIPVSYDGPVIRFTPRRAPNPTPGMAYQVAEGWFNPTSGEQVTEIKNPDGSVRVRWAGKCRPVSQHR